MTYWYTRILPCVTSISLKIIINVILVTIFGPDRILLVNQWGHNLVRGINQDWKNVVSFDTNIRSNFSIYFYFVTYDHRYLIFDFKYFVFYFHHGKYYGP